MLKNWEIKETHNWLLQQEKPGTLPVKYLMRPLFHWRKRDLPILAGNNLQIFHTVQKCTKLYDALFLVHHWVSSMSIDAFYNDHVWRPWVNCRGNKIHSFHLSDKSAMGLMLQPPRLQSGYLEQRNLVLYTNARPSAWTKLNSQYFLFAINLREFAYHTKASIQKFYFAMRLSY